MMHVDVVKALPHRLCMYSRPLQAVQSCASGKRRREHARPCWAPLATSLFRSNQSCVITTLRLLPSKDSCQAFCFQHHQDKLCLKPPLRDLKDRNKVIHPCRPCSEHHQPNTVFAMEEADALAAAFASNMLPAPAFALAAASASA